MGKQEVEKMLQMALDFLEGLTSEQFQELVDGNAVIRYEAKVKHTHYEELLKKIKQEANNAEDVGGILDCFKKKGLFLFCDYINLEIKTRDIKRVIFQKIASHVGIDDSPGSDSKEEAEPANWKQIEMALRNCCTINEGKDLLLNQELLSLKKNVVAFAKALGVYVNQRYTKQELLERIVDSVVGAQIRGKVIRSED